MSVIEGCSLSDGFAVSDLGFTDCTFDAVFSFHAFDVNVKVEFAHTGDDGFFGFSVEMNSESRVFALESIECF